MDKLDFIEYSASRYGIDFSTAETFVDIFPLIAWVISSKLE